MSVAACKILPRKFRMTYINKSNNKICLLLDVDTKEGLGGSYEDLYYSVAA